MLKIIKSGKLYRAHRNLGLDKAYSALADILGLDCECPIFGCMKYHRQCTNGKVSSSVRLDLNVPDEFVKLTEFNTWADFMYAVRFTKPSNHRIIMPDKLDEVPQRKMDKLIRSLKKQKTPYAYFVPQVVLAEIRPEWLTGYSFKNKESFMERFNWYINHHRKF